MKEFDKSANVLVTQAGLRNGFVITYSLGKMGIPVYCADTLKRSQTKYSRYCRQYSTYPSPHRDPDGYFDSINDLIKRHDIGLIFPAYDEVIFLSQNRSRLVNPKVLIAPPYENIMTVHNKTRLDKLCKQLNCNSPLTIELNDDSDVEKAFSQLSFPMVLKPERGGGGWGVTFVSSPDQFMKFWHEFDTQKHQNRLFAQQYIKGPLYGYGVLCDKGKILASNCYHTVRQNPIGRGTPSFRRGAVIEDIESQAEKIFGYLEWTGVCQCDFLLNEADGKSYLVDMNPRFWGSTAQALACGLNFPHLLYLLGTGQHSGAIARRTGVDVTSSWLWGDFFVMCERLFKDHGKLQTLREHFSGWRGAYFDDLRIDDPLPFLFYPIQKLLAVKSEDAGGF